MFEPITFTDGKIDPTSIKQVKSFQGINWKLREGPDNAWSNRKFRVFMETNPVDRESKKCPACKGVLEGLEYCLVCDGTAKDGEVEFPGIEIGKYINEGFEQAPIAMEGKARPTKPEDIPALGTIVLPSGAAYFPGGQVVYGLKPKKEPKA